MQPIFATSINGHVAALLIFMPRFNSINFYQSRPKIKLFVPKKYKIFERCPPLQIFGYAPGCGPQVVNEF